MLTLRSEGKKRMGRRERDHDGMRRHCAWRIGPDGGGEGCAGAGAPRPAHNPSILYSEPRYPPIHQENTLALESGFLISRPKTGADSREYEFQDLYAANSEESCKSSKVLAAKEPKEHKDKSLCCFSLRSLRSFAAIQLWLRLAALGLCAFALRVPGCSIRCAWTSSRRLDTTTIGQMQVAMGKRFATILKNPRFSLDRLRLYANLCA